ncbi:hypothetical protein HN031_12555 [Nocardioides sp. zg-1308]|uniref:Secreted protein n=1 Tax=Nocardioides renjunii TaxID=3095075 RepID=A0ABU5KD60_9ACTN|nr:MULTISPECIES: hypothetical protein [unclassified Nocardioides]MDZ5662816.1 hypothetical protein [Nocardioides sp. S-58]NPD05515.1 hypothetical protein [Nocardioides sp. zg-1308]WQQ23401.1 hypothetical protein SHK17_05325 [Nocardioides sp. S-34]
MRTRAAALGLAGALVVVGTLAGCTGEEGQVAAGHSHGAGGAMVSMPVGDGTRTSEVGYSLEGLQVRQADDGIGELRFRIEDPDGRPVTDYVEELTKELHLYLVNDELTVFRHLHPTRADDGTWTAPFDVPDAGGYRVVTEFVAVDEGGNGDHVVLGRPLALPPGDPGDTAAEDRAVQVSVAEAPVTGDNGLLRLVVRDAEGQPVDIGTFLGAYGHVTGFHTGTGAMVHLHPLAAPELTEDGSELTFHAEVEEPGDYRLFVQVRVDGFLHTVPVELTVARSA